MTSTTLEQRQTADPGWFVSWFDSPHYHKLYAYRDDTEAAGFVDALLSHLQPAPGSSILDLGCGTGRHSRYLASMGFHVTGLDLAEQSIEKAKRSELPNLHFFQHDMRAPFGTNAFDYVFSFFTSFGYFEDQSQHDAIIRNIARALKPGGVLMLDYLNVGYADAQPAPADLRSIDGVRYRLERWSDPRYFFKRIVVEDSGGHPLDEFLERVAKFDIHDFHRMFSVSGLNLDAFYGDYQMNSYDSDTSPRLILIARKAGQTVSEKRRNHDN